jgi:hypothetical protein
MSSITLDYGCKDMQTGFAVLMSYGTGRGNPICIWRKEAEAKAGIGDRLVNRGQILHSDA